MLLNTKDKLRKGDKVLSSETNVQKDNPDVQILFFSPKGLIQFLNSTRRTEKMEEHTKHLRRNSVANKYVSKGQNLISDIIKIFISEKIYDEHYVTATGLEPTTT